MKEKKEKKKITLREYHKKRMAAGIAIVVMQIFNNTVEHYKVDDKIWASVLFIVLAVLSLVFAVIWLYASCQDVDKEDELAKENMLKTHNDILTLCLILLAIAVLVSIFWDGSLTVKITSDTISNSWLIIWFGYMTLESAFFLHHEGKLSIDEEEE